jgi:tetratricopeptide (TPR) repeat protein
VPDRIPQRQESVALGFALARAQRNTMSEFWFLRLQWFIGLELGDRAEAERCTAQMHDVLEAVPLPDFEWNLRSVECTWMLIDGRLDELEAAAAPMLEFGLAVGMPAAAPTFGAHMFNVRLGQGRVDEALVMYEPIALENPNVAVLRSALILLYCEAGRIDDARRMFAAEVANDFAGFPYDGAWLSSTVRLAEIAARLDQWGAAEVLLSRLMPFCGQMAANITVVAGAVDLFVANALVCVSGAVEEANAHFDAALRMHDAFGARYLAARTRLDWADALLRHGAPDHAHVHELISGAQRDATALGFPALATRADALAERAG